MDTVRLGVSGLEITPIAYGTWQFGGDWGAVDEGAADLRLRDEDLAQIEGVMDDSVQVAGPSPETV
jgi:hypothetical protein